MTREEAIKVLSSYDVNGAWTDVDGKPYNAEEQAEAFDMAIEALEGVCFDEWCTDCKEYDKEKKCCPRFNKVIREAMKRVPHEDGTLEVKVEDATKIGRVLIIDDKHSGGLYYPDEYEPQGDLISRAEAIEAIELVDWFHQNRNKDMVSGANSDEHQAWYKVDDVYKALEAVPSAEAVPQSEQYKKGFEDAKRAFLVEYARESQNMRKRIAQLEVRLNAQKAISADRPRGEWIPVSEKLPDDGKWAIWCSNDGIIGIARFKEDCYNHFYPNGTSFGLEDAVAWMPLPEPYKGGDDK